MMRAVWVLLLLLLAGCGAAVPLTATPLPEFVDEGDPFYAPGFTLNDLNGQPHTLSDYRGRWVLLNFWQTTCVPCVEEMPLFARLEADLPGLTVLAVNVREPVGVIQPFMTELNLSFTVLQSTDSVTLDYTVMALPQTIVIDPNGEIQYRQFGPIDLDGFGGRLRALMGVA